MGWYRTLTEMRENGWTVAVHNDYNINGNQRTFWLLTHVASGLFVRGEGETDEVAVLECARQARQIIQAIAMTDIPDEMVERAAKAMKEFADNCAGDEWEIFDDDLALKVARAALSDKPTRPDG